MPLNSECTPLVSVVLPTHNRPDLLNEALQSLTDQTFSDWEAIVVDDASVPAVDGATLWRQFGPRLNLQCHAACLGGAAAKNTGIKSAIAPILAFLDDDDLFAPQFLARAAGVLSRHPDLDGLFMSVSWFGNRQALDVEASQRAMDRTLLLAKGTELEPGLFVFGPSLFTALMQTVPMSFQRVVVRRAALQRIGGYEPHCLLWDCDWAIRASAICRFGLVLDRLYHQRAQGQGTSSRPDRLLDQMLSVAEIKDRLYSDGETYGLNEAQRHVACKSAAAAWFSLAYYYCRKCRAPSKALAAWIKSQRRQPSLRRMTLLFRLLQTSISAGRSSQPGT
jgi:glycosyltransferase involved in cell wall biosynthesis